jgi:large subunit ribosomal protein L25
MTRLPLHVDFYEIDLKKAVRVKVPAASSREKPKGVAEGGLVSPIVREIEVDCLPTAIPENHRGRCQLRWPSATPSTSKSSKFPKESKSTSPRTSPLSPVPSLRKRSSPLPVEGAAAVAEPEVIGAKGKKEEEGAEGGAAKAAPGAAPGGDKKAAAAPAAKGGEKK